MPTYLNLHKVSEGESQARFRSSYELRHIDYELCRTTDRNGNINSDVRGGVIRIAINGFADATLLAWLFDSTRKEDGEVVTVDPHERVIEKFNFNQARAIDFRMNYDSRVKEGIITVLNIEAKEITTDNDLFFNAQ